MRLLWIIVFLISVNKVHSQDYFSTVQGSVEELNSPIEIVGASIELYSDSILFQSTITDVFGEFYFEKLPVGKYSLKVSMLGFTSVQVDNVNVQVAKTNHLTVKMKESEVLLNQVNISVNAKDETINTSIAVSGRAFNLEEAQRYSGSRSDIARMASNYAGVQGNNDTRNDIVVRGNSPTGLLWRVEGVDIFNPNHFAVAGTNGGPVAMINHKVIAKSDFITGAFPAEYGNAISGVFDLNIRNGNNKKLDFTGQLGVLGTELMAEGPIGKTRSSYLVAYRYSTLGLFGKMGINIGTQAIPQYQDLSFKLNFPLKKQGSISLFGIGGTSSNNTIVSNYTEPQEDLFSFSDRDVYFETGMGIVGIKLVKSFNKKWSVKSTLAMSVQDIRADHHLVHRPAYVQNTTWSIDSIVRKLDYQFISNKTVSSSKLTFKPRIQDIFTLGYSADLLAFDFYDSLYNESSYEMESRIDFNSQEALVQPYLEWKHFFNEKFKVVAGIHYQYFTLTNSQAIEPRLGLTYLLGENSNISLAYGRHSVSQPIYFYFQKFENTDGLRANHNRNMDFTRANHYVLSYKLKLKKSNRLKLELYYQSLDGVPVAEDSSAYSLINNGTASVQVQAESVVNEGTGRNMGLEITYEKFFVKDYFMLSTISVFDSKYKDLNGIEYNTSFNGRYAYNLLGGKSFNLGKKENKSLELGLKLTLAGGRYYTPIDLTESVLANTAVLNQDLINQSKYRDYSRLDVRCAYKVSLKKVSHVITLDLINVTNQKNQFQEIYVGPTSQSDAYTTFQNQLSFLPFLDYQFHF